MQSEVYNADAERAVLGCMLMKPALIKRTHTLLRCPNDMPFHIPAHQKIYDALLFLDESNIKPDRVTLLEYLDIDSPDTVMSEIISAVPTTANFENYCQIVSNHEMQRRLINETKSLTRALEAGAEHITDVKQRLAQLTESTKSTVAFETDEIGEYWNCAPITWTFQELLPRNITAVISSPGGLGKSLIGLGLALSVTTGVTLYPSFRPVDAPAHVLYLSGEDPIEIMRLRLNAYERRYFPSGDYRADIQKRFHLKTEGTGALIEQIRAGHIAPSAYYNHLYAYCEEIKPRLIVVDTLRRALGAANENDNAVVGYTMELITKLARVSNGTALVLSHVSKMGGQSKQTSADDARGASALKDEARTHFVARRPETGQGVKMTLVKANYSAYNLIGRSWFFGFDGACLIETGTQDAEYAEPKLLLPDIAAYIKENDESTFYGLTKRPGVELLIRRLITRGHDWVTPLHIQEAIQIGIQAGLFLKQWSSRGGHRREIVTVIGGVPVPVSQHKPTYTPSLPGVEDTQYDDEDEPFEPEEDLINA